MAREDAENEYTVKIDPESVESAAIAANIATDVSSRISTRLADDILTKTTNYKYDEIINADIERANILLRTVELIRDDRESLGQDVAELVAASKVMSEKIKILENDKSNPADKIYASNDIEELARALNIENTGQYAEQVEEENRRFRLKQIKDRELELKEKELKRKEDRQLYDDKYFGFQKDLVDSLGSTNQSFGATKNILGGIYSGDYGKALGGLSDIIGKVGVGEIESTGISAVLESMGMTGAAEVTSGVSAVLGGPVMAAIMGGIKSTDAIFDEIARARYQAMQQGLTGIDAITLGPGMALQDNLAGFMSGIDSKTIQTVRDTLFSNQAEWGSDEYNQGFDFALGAQWQYGINAGKAAKYYTDMVIKGGESMEQLSNQMESLQMTVENTAIGMDEMNKIIQSNTSTIASAIGGDQLAAQGMALDLQGYYTEGTGRESQIAAGMIGNLDFSKDPRVYNKMQEYVSQGYDETQAMMMVTMDYVGEGRILGGYGGQNYFVQPLTPDSLSIREYIADRDWDGLENALREFWTQESYNGMTYFGLRAALKAQFGFTDQDVESPETIVTALRGAVEGFDNAEEADYQTRRNVEYDRTHGARFVDENYNDLAVSLNPLNELMTSTSEFDLYQGQTFTTAGYGLAQLMSKAGVDFGEDGVTETELNLMAEGLRTAYAESGTETDFSDWIMTDEGKRAAQSMAERYSIGETGIGQESEETPHAEIALVLKDGLENILAPVVLETNNLIRILNGEQAGD